MFARKTASLVFNPGPVTRSAMSRSLSSNPIRSSCKSIAVLYQAVDPPVINGVRKPKKPRGYQDSGADIAYVLQQNGHNVITASENVAHSEDSGWCFPDTEEGILAAVQKGATHLWANTVLFGAHPLQTSVKLDEYASRVRVVGQPPRLVEDYDDKNLTNSLLRQDGRFELPASRIVDRPDGSQIFGIPYPIVGKPIRGRGSHGVKLCHNEAELSAHLRGLLEESPLAMVEAFLSGEEGTVTVMPPSKDRPNYYSLPIVLRSNHEAGIAPYSGVVAVMRNSRAVSETEPSADPILRQVCEECEQAAEVLRVTAPIRIDVRRTSSKSGSRFAMFDINMKPNMTGPGRPGREDQASLTAMAAAAFGWSYPDLLDQILDSARSLKHLRSVQL